MSNSAVILNNLKTALLNSIKQTSLYNSNDTGYGVDICGINPDNNAKVLSALKYFYNTDTTVKDAVDNTITWTKSKITTEGLSYYNPGPWGDPYTSSSSTGLTLALLASYGDADAALSYHGTLTFKSSNTQGAFDSGYGDDFGYGTKDIMEGLLSYSRLLSGNTNLYDLTDNATPINAQSISTLGYNPINNQSELPANSILSFAQVSSGTANYILIANSLNGIAKSFVAFDFSLYTGAIKNHNILGTPISLSLIVPEGFENPAIYYVDDQGNYTKMESTFVNGKISFNAPHFSTYVIVNELKATTPVTTAPPATTDTTAFMTYFFFALLSLSTIIAIKKRNTVN